MAGGWIRLYDHILSRARADVDGKLFMVHAPGTDANRSDHTSVRQSSSSFQGEGALLPTLTKVGA